MTSTDFLRLNGHSLFTNVRETLAKDINKTQNIMCVKDDVLYIWNFQDNCILTLNVKAARNEETQGVIHQTLLPQTPPLFTPHALIVNGSNTLVAVIGSKGVLVVELPDRCPPYGAFGNNKELIYCRSFSLHERILAFSNNLEVRQAKFHPGSPNDRHILLLTTDNLLRLYKIENGTDSAIGTYPVGIQPMGRFPKTKTTFLEALGEIAVDFDFAPPELKAAQPLRERSSNEITADGVATEKFKDLSLISNKSTSRGNMTKLIPKKMSAADEAKSNNKNLPSSDVGWPVLILYGNGDLFSISIDLKPKTPAVIKGPLPILPEYDENYGRDSCSILCIHTTPPIICIANCKGTIHHGILLPLEEDFEFTPEEGRPNFMEDPDRGLYIFERVELELGLATTADDIEYSCPILLHKNLGKLGHYFASHETGVHSVNIESIEDLHKFISAQDDDVQPEPDLFNQPSSAEYLLCTKVATSEKLNPVIGFAVYYDSPSMLALLANGQLISLTLATLFTIPMPDNIEPEDFEVLNSPLKKMLSEPFDVIIQRILKQSTTQPILKLSSNAEHTQQECYELLQRAARVFREEHFKNHNRAREEIEKRLKTLTKLKDIQKKDLERLTKEKQQLQGKAESLAEKYEDIKDKQEEMSKRCEKLLILIAKRRSEPSNAEKEFMAELNDGESKIETYTKAIAKIKKAMKYQELQMKNWHLENEKENTLGNVQIDAIKSNLHDMTQKITNMISELNEYKQQLNLK